jgi:hypothetical protein
LQAALSQATSNAWKREEERDALEKTKTEAQSRQYHAGAQSLIMLAMGHGLDVDFNKITAAFHVDSMWRCLDPYKKEVRKYSKRLSSLMGKRLLPPPRTSSAVPMTNTPSGSEV